MQFHLNGFSPGDPEISAPSGDVEILWNPDGLPEKVDVLIVGCGPAGLTLAAQLSAFPGIKTRIIEERSGPLIRGHADGVSCRSMEMFQAFGFADQLKKEAYWVNETAFWRPDAKAPGKIMRNGLIQDVEDGLSEMPHVILNQARVHDFFLDMMQNSASRLEPDYSRRLIDLQIDQSDQAGNHPVTVSIEMLDPDHEGQKEEVQARYVVGCDGARSAVRRLIGRELRGDSANQAWGVMDVLAVTDFPDIRKKCLIQSAEEGNIVLIPREGGYLARLYVELDKLSPDERVSNRNLSVDDLIAAAGRIIRPYSLDVKDVAWWSVYEIGQRLTDKFDDVPEDKVAARVPHVFIAGDACHTHSPKAGQGMNVSMGDAFNLGWKLAAVLEGRSPEAILHSYSEERQAVARDLIDFDREWASIMSAAPEDSDDERRPVFQDYFIKHGHYTAGMSVCYAPSLLTGEAAHNHLATGFDIGMRFHSAPVIRLADAKSVELGHTVRADGRWRIFAFSGQVGLQDAASGFARLCAFLHTSARSPIVRFTLDGADPDAVIDFQAVFQEGHRDLEFSALPEVLKPRKGRFGLIDYEKAFCADLSGNRDIFDLRGIDRTHGCMVVVRPDQYVSTILPLDAHDVLSTFFEGFMKP